MLLRKVGGPAIDISVLPDGRFRAAILDAGGERPLAGPSLFDADTAAQALAQARAALADAALADAEAAPARVVRAAAELTADLAKPKPGVYWLDFLLSAAIGYGALVGAIVISLWWLEATLGLIASVALYRALSFIHELTHLKPQALPGFRLAWNLLLGIPLLLPSFLYEGVHNLHHARSRYGTPEDPEYLPLHRMGRGSLLLFWLASLLMPLALLLRFAVLAPLSLLSPALRRLVVRRFSALSIAPRFLRALPAGRLRRDWIRLEVATSLWSWGFILLCASDSLPLAAASTAVLVVGGSALLNQTRTLVAHRWDSDGRARHPARPVSRQREPDRPAPAGRAAGAGRAALSRAAPPAAGPALSCPGRGAPAPQPRGPGGAVHRRGRRAAPGPRLRPPLVAPLGPAFAVN